MLFILEHLAPNPLNAEQVCKMLEKASNFLHKNLFNILLNKCIDDIDEKSLNENHILKNAVRLNNYKACLKLIEKGVDVNAKDEKDYTPLHWATVGDKREAIKLLLAAPGINVNAKNKDGETPLHRTAMNSNTEVIKLLLADERVEVNAKNKCGHTPLHYIALKESFFSYINFSASCFMQYLGLHSRSNTEVSCKENKLSLTYPGCYLPPCVSAGAITMCAGLLLGQLVKCALSRG